MLALDVARVVLAAVAALTGAYQVVLIRDSATPGQRFRLAGVAAALLVLGGARLQNLGQPITWQFIGAAVAILALAYGSYRWRFETPSQPRGPRRHHL